MSQRGELFTAILDYAERGVIPTFEDTMLQMAWRFVMPALDADDEKYRTKCLKKKYATYCRDIGKKGTEPLDFEDWLDAGAMSVKAMEEQQMLSTDIGRYPISNTSTISNSISNTASITDTISTAKGGGEQETDWVANRQAAKDALLNYGRCT